jgi:hypothetical protein
MVRGEAGLRFRLALSTPPFSATPCRQGLYQIPSPGGTRRSPLPNFYIGAHGAVRGYTFLTRDGARSGEYVPKLRIIAP